MSRLDYAIMLERQDALERLELCIPWGHYEIRVLRFHLTLFPPGRIVDFHNHAEFEFHFIPNGKGKVIIGDQEHPLSEGMFYLTGPGVMHYQEADPHEAMWELCLHVDIVERQRSQVSRMEADEAEACIKRLEHLPLIPSKDIFHAMPCFLDAYQACSVKMSGLYTTISHSVIHILLRSVRAYDSVSHETSIPARNMSHFRYQLAIQYIQANYSGVITLEHVAEKLHISSRQLQRIFAEMDADRTFSRILERIRMEAVCRQLETSPLSIDAIAVQEGFSNGNYLHSVFRKHHGMTPTQYRRMSAQKITGRN